MPGNRDAQVSGLVARQLVLEPLERRMLLSGNVTVLVSGVDLIITGDGADNNIKISQDGISDVDQFSISSPDGTTIDGGAGPRVFSGVFGNVLINMGAGNETVEVADCALPGNLTFNGGPGNNTLTVDPSTVKGSIIVTNGLGFDTEQFDDVNVGGSITINNGAGGSFVGFDAPPGSNEIVGNVTITNGAGFDQLIMNDTDITGSLTVNNGAGGAAVGFAPLFLPSTNGSGTQITSSSIGGNVSITNLAGVDLQSFMDVEIGDDLLINNGNGGTLPPAIAAGVDSIPISGSFTEMEGVLIHDDLVIKNGTGTDEQLFEGISVGGNASIDNGNGGTLATLGAGDGLSVTGSETNIADSEIDGNLTINNGTGADLQSFDELLVKGNMSISNGNGGSEITFVDTTDTVHVDGNLSITNGTGEDELYLGPVDVGGNFTVNNGAGGSEIESGGMSGPFTIGGSMSITDKTGMDMELAGFEIDGNLAISSGVGGASVLLEDSLIDGSLSFTAAGVTDGLTLEGMQINGNATITDGKGAFDFTSESNLDPTMIGGNLVLKNSGGLLTAVIDDTGITGNASITNGNGGSSISFDPLVLPLVHGNLTITEGNGADVVSLVGLTVQGKTSINTGGGTDTVTATGATFGGALGIVLGAGANDALTLTSVITQSTASFDGGLGLGDSLTITGGTFAFAPLYVNFETVSIV